MSSINTRLVDIRRHLSIIGNDGQHHINIHYKCSSTRLGQMLSTSSPLGFDYPGLGRFESIEGFWRYLNTKGHPDEFRTMDPNIIRHLPRDEESNQRIYRFRQIVMYATYLKIVQNPQLYEAFIACKKPFDLYYWVEDESKLSRPGGIVKDGRVYIRPEGMDFMISGLRSIRRLLLAGKVPTAPDVFYLVPSLAVRFHAPIAEQ